MHTIKDVKAKFPKAYSCGGDLIAVIDGKHVVLADLGNGGFALTKEGQRRMAEEVEAPKESKAAKAPKEPKAPKAAKEPEAPPAAPEKDTTLEDLLGE